MGVVGSLQIDNGMERVLLDIVEERDRQDAKFGVQNHHPICWQAILGEEYGEYVQTVVDGTFGGPTQKNMRDELVQVAAVAVAALECLDRNGMPEPVGFTPGMAVGLSELQLQRRKFGECTVCRIHQMRGARYCSECGRELVT